MTGREERMCKLGVLFPVSLFHSSILVANVFSLSSSRANLSGLEARSHPMLRALV